MIERIRELNGLESVALDAGQTLVEEIFKGQPKLEEQLVKMQQGY